MKKLSSLVVAFLLATALPAVAAEEMQVAATKVADGIYLLTGQGGNMAVAVGSEHTVLIDTQFAAWHDQVKAAVATVSPRPVDVVVNTHWHQDHTDGNAPFAAEGAVIIAHDAVRRRLAAGQRIDFLDRTVAPAAAAALPAVSFADRLQLHLGDRAVTLRHVGPAHTDGDVIVVFEGANVIHAGDLVFNRLYPFVDRSSGGSVSGVIRAVDELIALCDEKTVVIPGHGPLADRAALLAYRTMLVDVRTRVAGLVAQELDSAAVVAAKPTVAWDEVWGTTWLSGDQFTAIVDASLRAEAEAAPDLR